MTPIELVDALKVILGDVVKNYNLPTKDEGVTKIPTVYTGYAKESVKGQAIPSDFPFLIIRYLSDTQDISAEGETTVHVGIIIGTHNLDDENGWRDTVSIANRIKIELLKNRDIGPFRLINKIESDLFEVQPKPFYLATMELEFNAPLVQQEGDNFYE